MEFIDYIIGAVDSILSSIKFDGSQGVERKKKKGVNTGSRTGLSISLVRLLWLMSLGMALITVATQNG